MSGITFCATNTQAAEKKTQTNDVKVGQPAVLKQQCKTVGGDYVVHLSKDQVVIESQNLRIFSRAPKWDITIVNLTKKIYFHADFKVCLKYIAGMRSPFSVTVDGKDFRLQTNDENVAGRQAEVWSNDGGGKSIAKNSAKCWTLKSEKVAPQCAQIISTYYGMPQLGDRIPIRYVYTGTGNSLLPVPSRQFDAEGTRARQFSWLDTSSVIRAKTPPALFDIPKTYKQTKNYADIVVQGKNQSADTKFILEDLSRHPDALFNSR